MPSDSKEFPALPFAAIDTYIHAKGKIGVLVELACEGEFMPATEAFKELMHDIAMQIAASDPKFISQIYEGANWTDDLVGDVQLEDVQSVVLQQVRTGKTVASTYPMFARASTRSDSNRDISFRLGSPSC